LKVYKIALVFLSYLFHGYLIVSLFSEEYIQGCKSLLTKIKMKKIVAMLFALSVFVVPTAYATPGACSGHDGVNCAAGPTSGGSVICNDGWTGSSVFYRNMKNECGPDFHPFIDVGDLHPNEEAILTMYEKAIIIGYDDFTFRPDAQINRVEFLKILVESSGIQPDVSVYNSCFPDVGTDWYAPYVCYAKEQGWVQGYDDGTFKPVNNVNKVEAIKMLVETQGYTVNENLTSAPFSDVSINEWFSGYVDVAKNKGLLEDVGAKLNPAVNMTRAGITEMTYRALMVKENVLNSFDEFVAE
jgi:S-layer homology domain